MLTLFCCSLVLINSILLSFSIENQNLNYIAYFFTTQCILVWFLVDHLKTQRKFKTEQRETLTKSLASSPSLAEKKQDLKIQSIEFEMSSDFSFKEAESAPSSPLVSDKKFIFMEKNEKDLNRSQLEIVDDLIGRIPCKEKALLITNLYHMSRNPKNLACYFQGLCKESEILCNEISNNIDLIPHLGEIEAMPKGLLKTFFKSKSSQYGKIVFYLNKKEIFTIKTCLSPLDTTLAPQQDTEDFQVVDLNF